MKARSIRFRLTAWYGAILAITFAVFAAGLWLAMRNSILETVDNDLHSRLSAVSGNLARQPDESGESGLAEELQEQAAAGAGGAALRVADANGRWIYSSPETLHWPAPARMGAQTVASAGRRFRVLTERLPQGTAQIGITLGEFDEALNAFTWSISLMLPLLLMAASLGGYWISGRALKPVDEIARTARRIGADNLSDRLLLLGSGDELDRLSATLNGMFARLETAFSRITQFTADASHELRTPLAIIQTTVEVTLARPRTPEEHERAWRQVLGQTERTSKLIGDLLLLARADAGHADLLFQPVDLAETLRGVCAEMQPLAEASGLQIRIAAPLSCPANADAQAIQRLLMILLDNAVKYTPRGGKIDVSMRQAGLGAVIEVRDTGTGISREDLPRIFDRFYRTAQDRSRRTGGTGLGLSIAQSLAVRHGGEITVESAPGSGSLFRVTLPAHPR